LEYKHIYLKTSNLTLKINSIKRRHSVITGNFEKKIVGARLLSAHLQSRPASSVSIWPSTVYLKLIL